MSNFCRPIYLSIDSVYSIFTKGPSSFHGFRREQWRSSAALSLGRGCPRLCFNDRQKTFTLPVLATYACFLCMLPSKQGA